MLSFPMLNTPLFRRPMLPEPAWRQRRLLARIAGWVAVPGPVGGEPYSPAHPHFETPNFPEPQHRKGCSWPGRTPPRGSAGKMGQGRAAVCLGSRCGGSKSRRGTTARGLQSPGPGLGSTPLPTSPKDLPRGAAFLSPEQRPCSRPGGEARAPLQGPWRRIPYMHLR